MSIWDTLPFRAIRGTFSGFEDGLRGRIDTNEKFSDGYREEDPAKRSAAGAVLSDYAGIRGGSETGRKVGSVLGALGAMGASGWLIGGLLATGAFVGAWPIIATVLMVGAAGFFGSVAGEVIGKYAGGVLGAVAGAVAGPIVGLYNGVFRRGNFAKTKEPERLPAVDAPQVATPQATPQPGQGQSKNANLARAMQQVNEGMQSGAIGGAALSTEQAATPQKQGFAERVQQSVSGAGHTQAR